MRLLTLFLSMFLMVTILQAQDEVEVYEKEDGNRILLMGKNNLTEDVEITLQIAFAGFETKDQFPKKVILKPGEETIISTLVRPAGIACEYSISVSYKKVSTAGKKITRTTGVQINPTKVNVFTRDDCARCDFVISEFEKNKVVYLELNTNMAFSNKELMFEKLLAAGYKETTVQMPVVIYKGEIFYNIKDLKSFTAKFK